MRLHEFDSCQTFWKSQLIYFSTHQCAQKSFCPLASHLCFLFIVFLKSRKPSSWLCSEPSQVVPMCLISLLNTAVWKNVFPFNDRSLVICAKRNWFYWCICLSIHSSIHLSRSKSWEQQSKKRWPDLSWVDMPETPHPWTIPVRGLTVLSDRKFLRIIAGKLIQSSDT